MAADEPQVWEVPGSPPEYVLSVFDAEDAEWLRLGDGRWTDEHGSVIWKTLVVEYGPLREGRKAT